MFKTAKNDLQNSFKTPHYQRIEKFMKLAGQEVPENNQPTELDEATRLLRARLIMEEAMETVAALGVMLDTDFDSDLIFEKLQFSISGEFNLVEVVDGCADISVVTIGTLVACGIPDKVLLQLVDENNLAKFGPGGYRDENGKWVKPPGHKPPDIKQLIEDWKFQSNWIEQEPTTAVQQVVKKDILKNYEITFTGGPMLEDPKYLVLRLDGNTKAAHAARQAAKLYAKQIFHDESLQNESNKISQILIAEEEKLPPLKKPQGV